MTGWRTLAAVVVLLGAQAVSGANRTFDVAAHRFQFDITPSPFTVQQGDVVTLNITAVDEGQGFGHGFAMQRYAEAVNQVRVGTPITLQFTADTPGTFIFFCTVVCGEEHHVMSGTFTVVTTQPAPSIGSFTPAAGPVEGGNSVVVQGANFVSGAIVDFGTVRALSALVESATRLTATAPPQSAGSVAIKVTNPDTQSATSAQLYTYEVEAPPVIQIASVTPPTGSTLGGLSVVIRGSGFADGVTVTFGGVAATVSRVADATTLIVTTPPHAAGTVNVVVTGPNGSATKAGAFTYVAPPAKRRSVRH